MLVIFGVYKLYNRRHPTWVTMNVTSLDLFVLLSYLFCAIPIFTTIFLSRLLDRNPKRAYKRNKAIRLYGGAIYIVFNLFVFLPI